MTTMPPELGDSRKTQEMLWKQIKEQGHLPGFSNVVDQIVGAMQSEDEREFSMTRTVLSDPALTHRVLRLANSAMYAMFDDVAQHITFYRVPYDHLAAAAAIRDAGLPGFYADRLETGR